jgi:hypothetical protein
MCFLQVITTKYSVLCKNKRMLWFYTKQAPIYGVMCYFLGENWELMYCQYISDSVLLWSLNITPFLKNWNLTPLGMQGSWVGDGSKRCLWDQFSLFRSSDCEWHGIYASEGENLWRIGSNFQHLLWTLIYSLLKLAAELVYFLSLGSHIY